MTEQGSDELLSKVADMIQVMAGVMAERRRNEIEEAAVRAQPKTSSDEPA